MFLTLSFDLQYVKSANCKFYFYYHYQPIRIKHILTLYTLYQESPFDFNPSKRGLRYYTNKKNKIVKKKNNNK